MSIIKSRQLRTKMTDAERKLWYVLRDRRLGYKFRRQCPVGPYILDFASVEALIAIEVDGGQHSESVSDTSRTKWLEMQGWQIIRVWNNEVMQQTDAVAEMLLQKMRAKLKGI